MGAVIKDLKREPKIRPKPDAVNPVQSTHVVTLVPPNMVHVFWDDAESLLGPAVARSRGRWSLEYLRNAAETGRHQLWVMMTKEDNEVDGVATTEIVAYPHRLMLAIQYLGGRNMNNWVWEALSGFETFARDTKCHGIEATARYGFWKWLQQDGFDRSYTVFEKELSYE
jgi:hypothetical protein